jgi:prepilin-type N-terminal cleavage/methylation domain-containing protein
MIRNPRQSPRGFTMIEVLMVLGLLGIIMLVSDRLFVAGMHASSSSAQVQNHAMALDSAISALRADCWFAQKMTATPTRATLAPPGAAEPITWTTTSGTLIRHAPGTPDRAWPISADVKFATDGPSLLLEIVPNKTTAAAQFRLINEVALLGRMK